MSDKLIYSKAGEYKCCSIGSKYACPHSEPHTKQPIREPTKEHRKSDCDKYCGSDGNWGICIPVKDSDDTHHIRRKSKWKLSNMN